MKLKVVPWLVLTFVCPLEFLAANSCLSDWLTDADNVDSALTFRDRCYNVRNIFAQNFDKKYSYLHRLEK
jgi:hypothetical protein